ncbi:MAG: uroporphyrinogen-III C-methyltransferase [Bacteroidales bacterium]
MGSIGKVYITGAGPGDPDLLTIRARQVLECADLVVYDNLLNRELLTICPEYTRLCYAGKKPGAHHMRQEAINTLLVTESMNGKQVVRLKGGDPFIFGRGAEEALELRAKGIPYEIIPGISAGNAVPAYAGIPLTFRGLSSSVVFVTGSEDPLKDKCNVDWKTLARLNSTLVLYMAVANLTKITSALLKYGMDPNMPAAIIQSGTTYKQVILHSELAAIAHQAVQAKIVSPAIVIIGKVAGLGTQLEWFQTRSALSVSDY